MTPGENRGRPAVGKIRALLLGAALLSAVPAAGQANEGRRPTGIPEIDSLPAQDWGTPTKPLSMPLALGLAAVVPGGGQFYGGHPVRGSFLLGLETVLFGLAINTYQVDLPRRDRETRDLLNRADAAFQQYAQNPSNTAAKVEFESLTRAARLSADQRLQYADLANSQLAWAVGLHFYGMLDAVEIVQRSHESAPPKRSVGRAFVYGLALPGGGQLYNGSYGKFGMLWMALGASAVSAVSRQNVVEHLNGKLALAREERAAGFASNVSQVEQERQIFRRRRNQYYFAAGILTIYAVMDGMVDAALSDFDSPSRFAFGPGYEPFSIEATYSF